MTKPTASPLSEEECAFIDALAARLRHMNYYELLGVPRDTDRKAIRDAYFALSQRWHPDVFYARGVGERGARIEEIFKALTEAYDTLSHAQRRSAYDATVPVSALPPAPTTASTRPPSVPPARPLSVGPVASPPSAATPTTTAAAAPSTAAPAASAASTMPNIPGPPRVPTAMQQPVGSTLPPPRVVAARPVGQAPGPQMDPAHRAKALEAAAKKLGAQVGLRSKATLPPPRQLHGPAADDGKAQRVRALCEQADELRVKGDFDQALERLRAAETIDRADAGLRERLDVVLAVVNGRKADELLAKADVARRDGRVVVAVELYERAVEARPDPEIALRAAELCLRKKDLHRRGVDLAQKALAARPDDVKALLVMAQIFVATELKASARGALDRAARIDPNNPEVKTLRASLGPVSLAEQLGLRNR